MIQCFCVHFFLILIKKGSAARKCLRALSTYEIAAVLNYLNNLLKTKRLRNL